MNEISGEKRDHALFVHPFVLWPGRLCNFWSQIETEDDKVDWLNVLNRRKQLNDDLE